MAAAALPPVASIGSISISTLSSIFGDVFFPSNVNVYVFKNAKGYSDKSYKPYIKQFAYLDNDIFKDESSMEAISVGEHKVILEAETIYASLYKYYVKNENGEFELIKETNEPICEYEAYLGNKTYEFKVDMIIKKDKQEFVTTVFDEVYVSKTQEEYLLDYLILEIISLSSSGFLTNNIFRSSPFIVAGNCLVKYHSLCFG